MFVLLLSVVSALGMAANSSVDGTATSDNRWTFFFNVGFDLTNIATAGIAEENVPNLLVQRRVKSCNRANRPMPITGNNRRPWTFVDEGLLPVGYDNKNAATFFLDQTVNLKLVSKSEAFTKYWKSGDSLLDQIEKCPGKYGLTEKDYECVSTIMVGSSCGCSIFSNGPNKDELKGVQTIAYWNLVRSLSSFVITNPQLLVSQMDGRARAFGAVFLMDEGDADLELLAKSSYHQEQAKLLHDFMLQYKFHNVYQYSMDDYGRLFAGQPIDDVKRKDMAREMLETLPSVARYNADMYFDRLGPLSPQPPRVETTEEATYALWVVRKPKRSKQYKYRAEVISEKETRPGMAVKTCKRRRLMRYLKNGLFPDLVEGSSLAKVINPHMHKVSERKLLDDLYAHHVDGWLTKVEANPKKYGLEEEDLDCVRYMSTGPGCKCTTLDRYNDGSNFPLIYWNAIRSEASYFALNSSTVPVQMDILALAFGTVYSMEGSGNVWKMLADSAHHKHQVKLLYKYMEQNKLGEVYSYSMSEYAFLFAGELTNDVKRKAMAKDLLKFKPSEALQKLSSGCW